MEYVINCEIYKSAYFFLTAVSATRVGSSTISTSHIASNRRTR